MDFGVKGRGILCDETGEIEGGCDMRKFRRFNHSTCNTATLPLH